MVLPVSFRDELGQTVYAAIVDLPRKRFISIYTESQWENTVTRLNNFALSNPKGDNVRRRILANASKLEIDSLGRVLIPQNLRAIVSIAQDVTVNGIYDRLEIWDSSRWNEYESTVDPDIEETLAQLPGL
jgi:MraZ protein